MEFVLVERGIVSDFFSRKCLRWDGLLLNCLSLKGLLCLSGLSAGRYISETREGEMRLWARSVIVFECYTLLIL